MLYEGTHTYKVMGVGPVVAKTPSEYVAPESDAGASKLKSAAKTVGKVAAGTAVAAGGTVAVVAGAHYVPTMGYVPTCGTDTDFA